VSSRLASASITLAPISGNSPHTRKNRSWPIRNARIGVRARTVTETGRLAIMASSPRKAPLSTSATCTLLATFGLQHLAVAAEHQIAGADQVSRRKQGFVSRDFDPLGRKDQDLELCRDRPPQTAGPVAEA
jgi:hypothetical protein